MWKVWGKLVYSDHDHRGEYAPASHNHYVYDVHGAAQEYHRHYDLESEQSGQDERITGLEERIANLADQITVLEARLSVSIRSVDAALSRRISELETYHN